MGGALERDRESGNHFIKPKRAKQDMKSLLQKYNLTLIALLLALLSSCEAIDDNGQETEKEPQPLNSLSFNLSRGLPEGTLSDSYATSDEWFYDWHIAIVNDKGLVEVAMHRNSFQDADGNALTTPSNGIEEESVNTSKSAYSHYFDGELTPGTKKVYEGKKHIYVFANMSLPTAFEEGKYITPDVAMALTTTVAGNREYPSTSPIPMSNVVEVTLNNELNQLVDLPLFRMLAKVEFTFTSMSETPITIEEITMNHVTTNDNDNIYLFSNLDSNDYPLMPSTSKSGNYSTGDIKDASNNWALQVVKTGSPKINSLIKDKVTYTLYVNESKKPISEYIGFTLTTRREGGATQAIRYALAESAPSLRRNDFLKIPVKLSDYEFNPRIDFFPPIGGYSPAVITSDPSEVFFVTVKSGGLMTLRPQLYNAATNTPIPDDPLNQNPSITVEAVSPTTSVGDILSDLGSSKYIDYNNVDGWYNATVLGTTPGKVLFTLQYKIEDPDNPGNYIILQRKIYLIVEQP